MLVNIDTGKKVLRKEIGDIGGFLGFTLLIRDEVRLDNLLTKTLSKYSGPDVARMLKSEDNGMVRYSVPTEWLDFLSKHFAHIDILAEVSKRLYNELGEDEWVEVVLSDEHMTELSKPMTHLNSYPEISYTSWEEIAWIVNGELIPVAIEDELYDELSENIEITHFYEDERNGILILK